MKTQKTRQDKFQDSRRKECGVIFPIIDTETNYFGQIDSAWLFQSRIFTEDFCCRLAQKLTAWIVYFRGLISSKRASREKEHRLTD